MGLGGFCFQRITGTGSLQTCPCDSRYCRDIVYNYELRICWTVTYHLSNLFYGA